MPLENVNDQTIFFKEKTDFPEFGREQKLYLALDELLLYVWIDEEFKAINKTAEIIGGSGGHSTPPLDTPLP